MRDVGVIRNGGILCEQGKIVWVGSMDDPACPDPVDIPVIDANDKVVLPGFVDSHTHAVFAGGREDEFAMRSRGATYQEIAAAGGGILSTMNRVRAAGKKELKRNAAHHMTGMMRHGTTTVEVKSGYGLSTDAEIRMLEAINELKTEEMINVVPTFIGAHAVPPEYAQRPREYLSLVTGTMIPYVGRKNLAAFCDVFCDAGYFPVDDAERVLRAGIAAGMKPKIHADELSPSGGAVLAGKIGAVSADHLEHITDEGIRALERGNVVATLLPGVSFFLNHGYAPARALIDADVAVAIATDFNPGSCMSYSMPMMMTIACTQMHMSPEEALTAATLNGAAALGMSASIGSIEAGKAADLIVANTTDFRTLAYHFGTNHICMTIKNGTILEF